MNLFRQIARIVSAALRRAAAVARRAAAAARRAALVGLAGIGALAALFVPAPHHVEDPEVPETDVVEELVERTDETRTRVGSEDVKLGYTRAVLAEIAAGRDVGATLVRTRMLSQTQKSWLAMTTPAEAEVLLMESPQELRRRLLGIGRGWRAHADIVAERIQEIHTTRHHGPFATDDDEAHDDLVSALAAPRTAHPAVV